MVNVERRREIARNYYQRHRERLRVEKCAQMTAHYHANKEKFSARHKQWYAANSERMKEGARAYRRTLSGRYSRLKGSAKQRGHDVGLDFEAFCALAVRPCVYCAASPDGAASGRLDRLDNSKGYILGNVVPCCGPCNNIRGANLSHEEMLIAMQAVLAYRSRRVNVAV